MKYPLQHISIYWLDFRLWFTKRFWWFTFVGKNYIFKSRLGIVLVYCNKKLY